MPYKYNKTIKNGAERLIDGIENIEMFLGEEDAWNFHDSEIHSIQWDRDSKTFSVTIDLIGCDFSQLEGYNYHDNVLLEFHFTKVAEVHMPHVDMWNCEYIYEIEISKDRNWLECWFNGFCMRVVSERLRVEKPRIIKKKNTK